MIRGRDAKLGLFVIGTAALLVLALLAFADVAWWRREDHYRIYFDRTVSGLNTGARVEVWGVPVGTVHSISIERSHRRPVVVRIAVEHGTRIPTGARAYLDAEGLIGVKFIDVAGGDLSGAVRRPGDEIPSGTRGLERAVEQAEDAAARLNSLLARLDRIASDMSELTGAANRSRVASILAGVDQAVVSAANATAYVSDFAEDLRRRSKRTLPQLEAAGVDFHAASSAAVKTANEAQRAVADIERAAAAAQALVRGGSRDLRVVLTQLRAAADGARSLVRTLEENPAGALRGQPPRERPTP